MPSFLKKIFHTSLPGGKSNPYSNAQHPNNPTNTASQPTTTAQSSNNPFRSKSQPAPLRPASPRESIDYLAEARQALGRDPVTGKKAPSNENSRGGRQGGAGDAVARGRGEAGEAGDAVEVQGAPQRGRSSNGTRYDDFVREMKDRGRGGWREPEGGFYAPQRLVGEYYAPQGEFYAPTRR